MRGRRTFSQMKLMGTVASFSIPGDVDDSITSEVGSVLRSLESRLTVNGPPSVLANSQVHAVNAAAGLHPVSVDGDVYDIIRQAVMESRNRENGFNALIGPVVKAWNIGFDDARVPSPEEINALLPLTDPDEVTLDDSSLSVCLHREGMRLDLGAIAKGYAADKAAQVYRKHGILQGLLDLGGNVLAMGPSDAAEDGFWKVGIQSPFHPRGTILGYVKVKDASVVTSGVYERVLKHRGRLYHHMIDPRTGYPFEHDLSGVTVIAEHSVKADLWATAAQQGGLKKGRAAAEKEDGVEAVFITSDRKMTVTAGIRGSVTITDAGIHCF